MYPARSPGSRTRSTLKIFENVSPPILMRMHPATSESEMGVFPAAARVLLLRKDPDDIPGLQFWFSCHRPFQAPGMVYRGGSPLYSHDYARSLTARATSFTSRISSVHTGSIHTAGGSSVQGSNAKVRDDLNSYKAAFRHRHGPILIQPSHMDINIRCVLYGFTRL